MFFWKDMLLGEIQSVKFQKYVTFGWANLLANSSYVWNHFLDELMGLLLEEVE